MSSEEYMSIETVSGMLRQRSVVEGRKDNYDLILLTRYAYRP